MVEVFRYDLLHCIRIHRSLLQKHMLCMENKNNKTYTPRARENIYWNILIVRPAWGREQHTDTHAVKGLFWDVADQEN